MKQTSSLNGYEFIVSIDAMYEVLILNVFIFIFNEHAIHFNDNWRPSTNKMKHSTKTFPRRGKRMGESISLALVLLGVHFAQNYIRYCEHNGWPAAGIATDCDERQTHDNVIASKCILFAHIRQSEFVLVINTMRSTYSGRRWRQRHIHTHTPQTTAYKVRSEPKP